MLKNKSMASVPQKIDEFKAKIAQMANPGTAEEHQRIREGCKR